jgi:imidazolonepropionase-like amidohydrolase
VRHPFPSFLLLFALSQFLVAQERRTRPHNLFAITHVIVIDATGAPAKTDMTVIVAGDRIVAIGKSNTIHLPRGTRTLEATGKFLIPGLWDMHVHIGNDERDKTSYLPLFIANGVTGIRIMAGEPEHHLWRKEIESGALLGPRMVIASRIVDGPKSFLSDAVIVHNEAEAREAVRKAVHEGADFVKVHDNILRTEYFAVIDEARRQHLPVEGHVPAAITATEASGAGQKSIEHFTGLNEAENDPRKADELIGVLRKNHTWICPTIIMRNNYAVLDDPQLANDPRLRYIRPTSRNGWIKMTTGSSSLPASDWAGRRETVRREKLLIGRMRREGIGILAGTDNGNPYVFPGFSLHEELVMLVESGLTPMQALQAATLNPAKFFNQHNSLGTVEKGKLADLVLLDSNPLADIHNTSRINAVVVNGRLFQRSSLDEILVRVEAAMKTK